MGLYRATRAIESSVVDYLIAQLVLSSWTGINVIKSSAEIYLGKYPAIVVMVAGGKRYVRREIGSKTYIKYYTLNLRIFADNDGQRLDLAEWLGDLLEFDIDYYTYTITNGVVSSKVLAGKINITEIIRDDKELTNTEGLIKEDRCRHLITCRVKIN